MFASATVQSCSNIERDLAFKKRQGAQAHGGTCANEAIHHGGSGD